VCLCVCVCECVRMHGCTHTSICVYPCAQSYMRNMQKHENYSKNMHSNSTNIMSTMFTWNTNGYPWRISSTLKNPKVLRVHNLKNTSTYKTKGFNIYIILLYNNFITINKNARARNYLSMTTKQNFWFLHPTGIAHTVLCTTIKVDAGASW
jgi:hypothetical protein